MTMATLIKESWLLQFRELVHYYHDRKHADRHGAGEGAERVLHPDQQAAGRESDTGPGLNF